MTNLDQIVIDRVFSPAAGWAQHRLGVSQWRLSIECLNGNIAFYLAAVALTVARKGLVDGIFVDLLAASAWLLIMDFVRRLAQRQSGSSLGVQTARMREWMFRVLLLAMLPLSLCYVRGPSSFCYTAALALLVAHLYFKASDTPPPEQRRKLAYNGA